MIEIDAKGMDALKQALAGVKVSPAIQSAMSEAMRQWSPMIDTATRAGALGVALDHLRRGDHERRMSEPNRRTVTEEDLAALGIKRLPT